MEACVAFQGTGHTRKLSLLKCGAFIVHGKCVTQDSYGSPARGESSKAMLGCDMEIGRSAIAQKTVRVPRESHS